MHKFSVIGVDKDGFLFKFVPCENLADAILFWTHEWFKRRDTHRFTINGANGKPVSMKRITKQLLSMPRFNSEQVDAYCSTRYAVLEGFNNSLSA